MVVGMLNTFAALARATTLFFSVWRSIDWTPNAICGCWSMKRSCEFCGVRTSSFGLDMLALLRLGPRHEAPFALKFAFEDTARISPRWGDRLALQRRPR